MTTDSFNHMLNTVMLKLCVCGLACTGLVLYWVKLMPAKGSAQSPSTATAPTAVEALQKPQTTGVQYKKAAKPRPPRYVKAALLANISHVNHERSIVMFKNGTSLFVTEPHENPAAYALEKMARLNDSKLHFASHKVDGGHMIVSFEGLELYHWVFADESHEINVASIGSLKNLLSEGEMKKLPANWHPLPDAKAGLLARSWLAADLKNPQIIRILKAKAPSKTKMPSTASTGNK